MYKSLLVFVFFYVAFASIIENTNEHPTKPFNSLDPDCHRDLKEILENANYTVHQHSVVTPDGYILELFHIPARKVSSTHTLYVHGLAMNPVSWFFGVLPRDSLPLLTHLHTNSHVWIMSLRGTSYGLKHTNYTSNDREFWNFSHDEHVSFDLPTVVSFIHSTQKVSKLSIIAHSEGSLITLAGLASIPQLNNKITSAIVLAPAYFISNIKTPFFSTLAKLSRKTINHLLGHKSLLMTPSVIDKILPGFCKLAAPLCRFSICLIAGCDGATNMLIDDTRSEVLIAHAPDTISIKNAIHFAQMVKNKENKLYKFDYESESENRLHYGQPRPPFYNLSNIKVPVYLWNFMDDTLVTPTDVERLASEFKFKQWNQVPRYGHGDAIWSKFILYDLLPDILRQLNDEGIY
ncbi:hypothetical protein RCL1_007072 [Eukaryota sp. TZLM3-RCL]